jgi:ubiquinone/menaquinone biosynthesis C-methylase UbiE
MQSKPEDARTYFADTFKDHRVVNAYRHRAPYPDEVFDILASLITDEPRAVLDVGAGFGDIARKLVNFVERVDAVDFSQNMIERGKQLPNGDSPHLRWIYGKVEEVHLSPPYTLITAGSSIHWMEWEKAFPLFRSVLTPHGYLALVYRRTLPMPWDADMRKLRAQFLSQGDHRSSRIAEELETRGFFHRLGEKETAPVPFFQSIDDFIEGLHSRSRFSREYMGQQQADDLDQRVRTLLLQFHKDGILPLQVVGSVIWGTPEKGLTNGRTD